jgi:hypothetical protein
MLIPIQGTNYDGEADIRQQVEAGFTPYTPRGYRWWRYFRASGEYTMNADGVERLMSISTTVQHKASGYTILASDFAIGGTASGGACTIALPACSTCKGRQFVFWKMDTTANYVVLSMNGGDTIEGAAGKSLTTQYHAVWIQSDGVSKWVVLGERFGANPASSFLMVFSDPGSLPAGTRYFRPGTASVSTNEIFFKMTRACTMKNLSVNARVAPGTGKTDVFTVRKEAVDTSLTASLAGANTYVIDNTHTVSFAAGDRFSLKSVGGANTAEQDVVVTVEVY